MREWEYKVVVVFSPTEDWLNKMGSQGWELVTVWDTPARRLAAFKRPVESFDLDKAVGGTD